MSKKFDEIEIAELENQAALKQRHDAAMKILEPEKSDPVDVMREREAQRRADQRQANMDARAYRLKGMLATEGGRYSPVTIANARKYLEENGYGMEGERRRQHDETQKTERIKAGELTRQAEIKAAAEREMSRNKDGWWDDQGNFHPGASVKAAEAGGAWHLAQQQLKNENAEIIQDKKKELAEAVEDKKGQRAAGRDQTLENIATTQANARVESARLRKEGAEERRAQQDALAEQRDFEKFKKDVNNVMNVQFTTEQRKRFRAMTPEEQKAFWKEYQGRQQEPQLPKVEGYTPEMVAELIKRGYKVVDGKFVK